MSRGEHGNNHDNRDRAGRFVSNDPEKVAKRRAEASKIKMQVKTSRDMLTHILNECFTEDDLIEEIEKLRKDNKSEAYLKLFLEIISFIVPKPKSVTARYRQEL